MSTSDKKYSTSNSRPQPGFSIIEIVVVIMIVTFGIVGLLSLTIQTIKIQGINKNSLIAAELAQEGIELARNYRDSNWKLPTPAIPFLGNGNYVIDYTFAAPPTTPATVADINAAGARLYIDANGYYRHTGATATPFRRVITVNNAAGNASTTVTCIVRFANGTTISDYKAETVMYDWQ